MEDAAGVIKLSIVLMCGNPGPNPTPKEKKSERQTALSERLQISTIDEPHTCRLMGGVCGCRQWFEQIEKKSVASRWTSCSALTQCDAHKDYDFIVHVKDGIITVHFKGKKGQEESEAKVNSQEETNDHFDRLVTGKKQYNLVKSISWTTPEKIAEIIKKDDRCKGQRIRVNRDGYYYLKFTLLFASDGSENLILYSPNARKLEFFYRNIVELLEGK